MEIYLHDSSAALRFVLRGDLAGDPVLDLKHAWTTACSILGSRELIVDISALTRADPDGRELLSRMRQSGARMETSAIDGNRGLERRFRHLPGTRRPVVVLDDENTGDPLDDEMH